MNGTVVGLILNRIENPKNTKRECYGNAATAVVVCHRSGLYEGDNDGLKLLD